MLSEVITLPADDADVLATAVSPLERAPEDGRYEIWAASDQVDGLISVMIGQEVGLDEANMKVQTVNQLDMAQAPLYSVFVEAGTKVTINYNEVTAGTGIIGVRFSDEVDLLAEGISLSALGG